MNQRIQNFAVGLTVLTALALLATMILMFTGLPGFLTRGYNVPIHMKYSTGGVKTGDAVNLMGVKVGRITDIGFTDPADATKGITLTALIDREVNVPANVEVQVSQALLGSTSVNFVPVGREARDEQGRPIYLSRTNPPMIEAKYLSGDPFERLAPVMDSLGKLAANLNAMVEPEPGPATGATGTTTAGTTTTASGPAEPARNLRTVLANLNLALMDVHTVLGDKETQANVKTAVANLSKASTQAVEVMDQAKTLIATAQKTAANLDTTVSGTGKQMDQLFKKAIDDADQISTLLMTFNRMLAKVDSGEGTAGKLLADPKLYNSLVDTTQRLDGLIKDFNKLVEDWQANGVKMKLR